MGSGWGIFFGAIPFKKLLTKGGQIAKVTEKVVEHAAELGAKNTEKTIHKNSLSYVCETHVYAMRGSDGVYKIGESAQGLRVLDQASIRAEQQARKLSRETGDFYKSEILKTFENKAEARAYETRLIERFRSMCAKINCLETLQIAN